MKPSPALLLAALLVVPAAARADAVPADYPDCPPGSQRKSVGAGRRICAPALCESDLSCAREGGVCRETSLCVGKTNLAGSFELTEDEVSPDRPPSCPRDMKAAVLKTCVPRADRAPPPVKPSSGCGCGVAGSRGSWMGIGVGVAWLARRLARRRTR
jgi:hypothetical protein